MRGNFFSKIPPMEANIVTESYVVLQESEKKNLNFSTGSILETHLQEADCASIFR